MRYPAPWGHPRNGACPLCEAPVEQVAVYAAAPAASPPHEPVAGRPQRADVSAGSQRLVGVLDNIRSALNVGTMLRSADAAGLDRVYLGGLTADADNPKVIKTALGAERSVATTRCLDLTRGVADLRAAGYRIWAVDHSSRSVSLHSLRDRPSRLAFVVGNERAGVDPVVLEAADRHVHIDMLGAKTTINVGVAFGTVAYHLRFLTTVV